MSYDKKAVIEFAQSQIGYREKSTNSQLDDFNANAGSNNWNKYARDLDKLKGFYNGPKNIGPQGAWCDIFVDDCFVEAYGREAAQFLLCQPDNSCGAGCQFSAAYFNAKGQFYKSNPEPGDQIFFGNGWQNIWHTGLVVSVKNGIVTTIEGNTSNMVAERKYAINDANIWGYGRPDWGEQPPVVEVPEQPTICSVELPVLQIGDEGEYVKAAQTLLIALSYDCGNRPLIGTEKADGEFGRCTERSVGFFQSKRGLEPTGIIDGATWAALLKLLKM